MAVADFEGLPIEGCAEFGRLCCKRLMDGAKELPKPRKTGSGVMGAVGASFMFPLMDAWFQRGDQEKVIGWAITIADPLFSAGPVAQEQAWQQETLASIRAWVAREALWPRGPGVGWRRRRRPYGRSGMSGRRSRLAWLYHVAQCRVV